MLLEDGYLFLECALESIVDDFEENALIAGRIVAAHSTEITFGPPTGTTTT